MGEFPNKATQFKSGKKQVEIARAAGKKRPKSTINYSIRKKVEWMMKDGYSQEEAEKVLLMARDPQASADDLYDKMEKFHQEGRITDKDFLHFKGQFHRLTHGDKLNVTQKTINFNVELNTEEVQELNELLND